MGQITTAAYRVDCEESWFVDHREEFVSLALKSMSERIAEDYPDTVFTIMNFEVFIPSYSGEYLSFPEEHKCIRKIWLQYRSLPRKSKKSYRLIMNYVRQYT